jgi:IclR family acetate operon transcriptional repressor
MLCIAAPDLDINSEAVAGISVSGPTSRVSDVNLQLLSGPVCEAAQALTAAIGGIRGESS